MERHEVTDSLATLCKRVTDAEARDELARVIGYITEIERKLDASTVTVRPGCSITGWSA